MQRKIKVVRKIEAVMLTMLLLFSSGMQKVPAVYASSDMPKTQCAVYTGSNIESQNYNSWSATVKSYLAVTEDSGLMRVQVAASLEKYLVEYYDAAYNIKQTRMIDRELPIFGGFYESDNNYYILSGQSNPQEQNDVEVYRITKYDKTWNRIGACGLYGANTYFPFEAGTARMTVSGNYLLIRTCHTMYDSGDGYHHQANVTIQVDMSSMEITDSFSTVANNTVGYVSHSFNQFIDTENNKIIAVDHGDAYPRAIVLTQYNTDYTGGKFNGKCTTYNLIEIAGTVGANYTGYSIGGFEISDSSYLVAGNEDIGSSAAAGRNVFVLSMNKSTKTITKHMITDYPAGTSVSTRASTPHFVQIGNNSYMLLWNKEGVTYYTKIDGTGNQTGSIYSLPGNLSDCVPVVSGEKLIWYTWNSQTNTFYSINISSPSETETVTIVNGHKLVYSEPDENCIVTGCCSACEYQEAFNTPSAQTYWWKGTNSSSYYGSYDKRYAVGAELPYLVKTVYSENADTALSYHADFEVTSSDETVLTVNQTSKKLVMVGAGLATVTIRAKYNSSVGASFVFRVGDVGAINLSQCEVALAKDSFVYTGTAHVPDVSVSYNGYTLQKGTDYTVTAVNNTNVGTATLTVTGAGIFGGELDRTFTIEAGTLQDCVITLNKDTYAYSGSAVKPTVKVSNGNSTVKTDMYSVTYSDNIIPGQAKVTITGTDSLPGTVTKYFTIVPCDLSECSISFYNQSSYPERYIYSGTEKKNIYYLFSKDGAGIYSSLYTATYSNNINAGEASVTLTPKDNNGYIIGSLTKTFIIKPMDISAFTAQVLAEGDIQYNGKEQKPAISVVSALHSVDTEQCEIVYENNVNVGTAAVTVTGNGNYAGSVATTFAIAPCAIETCTVTLSEDTYTYCGSALAPTVNVVTPGGVKLTEGTDYTVDYQDNVNAGTATVIVTGKDNCKGETTTTFTIQKATPILGEVTVDTADNIYTSTLAHTVSLNCTPSVPGTLSLDKVVFSTGEGTYGYTFVPTDTENYHTVTGTVTLTVKQDTLIKIELSGEPSKTEYMYGDAFCLDGCAVTAFYESGIQTDVTEYVWAEMLKVGTDEVILHYVVDDVDLTCTVNGLTVAKKLLDISGLYWKIPASDFVFDGEEKRVELIGDIPEELTVVKENDMATEAGTYTAKASLSLAAGLAESNYDIQGNLMIMAEWRIAEPESEKPPTEKPAEEDTSSDNTSSEASTEKDTAEAEETTAEVQDTTAEAEDTTAEAEDTTAEAEDTTAEATEETTAEPEKKPAVGTSVKDKKTDVTYKVVKEKDGSLALQFAKTGKKTKGTVTIPETVKIANKKYKVTSIAANAFKNNKKVTKVIIGKNVAKIGSRAFYGCSKLKNLLIRTTKLAKSKVGTSAFKGIYAKVVILVPAKKYSAYKSLLKAKGVGKKAVIKKAK